MVRVLQRKARKLKDKMNETRKNYNSILLPWFRKIFFRPLLLEEWSNKRVKMAQNPNFSNFFETKLEVFSILLPKSYSGLYVLKKKQVGKELTFYAILDDITCTTLG